MQEAHGGRLIGRRRFIQLGAAAGMTMFALGVTGVQPPAGHLVRKEQLRPRGVYRTGSGKAEPCDR